LKWYRNVSKPDGGAKFRQAVQQPWDGGGDVRHGRNEWPEHIAIDQPRQAASTMPDGCVFHYFPPV
jgi:hypothetical protein